MSFFLSSLVKIPGLRRWLQPTVVARHREHLVELIEQNILKYGPACDLNHIAVSQITTMESLFSESQRTRSFVGNISKWNTSNVSHMARLFEGCAFNGDISKWNLHPKCKVDNAFLHFHPSPLGMACALQRGTPAPEALSGPMSLAVAVCESLGLQGITAGFETVS